MRTMTLSAAVLAAFLATPSLAQQVDPGTATLDLAFPYDPANCAWSNAVAGSMTLDEGTAFLAMGAPAQVQLDVTSITEVDFAAGDVLADDLSIYGSLTGGGGIILATTMLSGVAPSISAQESANPSLVMADVGGTYSMDLDVSLTDQSFSISPYPSKGWMGSVDIVGTCTITPGS